MAMAIERLAGRGRQPASIEAARERLIERQARSDESREAWGRVIYLTGRGHLSVVADRPDVAAHTFGEIRSIATRSLRRLDGGDAA